MSPIKDYDGTYRVPGFEQLEFSSERDARHAIYLATQFAAEQHVLEFRYRRAAERAGLIKSVGDKTSAIAKPALSQKDRQRCSELVEYLSEAFCFDDTPQGYEYWNAIRAELRNLAGDLA